ncbi:enoyl-CoA hydratase/isomerase family protein [Rhabdothermincola sediminis]|uniref:enoyl-CoA hydratase/isomerase family protein n=1 Tax=Rhabdothermincola sediminis TaxID=2751370 RepID=UPI001AA08C3B|nr:enoyl-CoA hydratase-related protein [Rhabdothermincola sediminis]
MSNDRPLDEQVLFRCQDGVAWITLNRPEAHNAITPDQRNRVIDLLAEAGADLATRAVVLTATGKGFCTGADLRGGGQAASPARPAGAPERAVGDVSRMLRIGAQRLIAAILDCEKPVIAAVNGTAAGIGAHMALACDLVLAARSARFIEVFVRRGLVPDGGGAYLLPRLIGLHETKELMFFGDSLPAERAAALGLVNLVVDDDRLEEVATEWAGRLAAGPTRSIALTKWLVNRSLESDRAAAFDDEAVAQELNMGTHDAQEGVASFVERRDPQFRGW